MGKKRSRGHASAAATRSINETFDDSEDEFIKGRNQILFDDEGPVAKRRRKIEQEEAELMPSDEEVYEEDEPSENDDMAAAAADDTSDDDARGAGSEEDDDEQYWGTDRADYYNADAIETEQDALDEETEARRLHQKQLQDMTEADFGFDELAWADGKDDAARKPLVEKLQPVKVPKDATDEQKLEILRSRYPEFEPLVQDLHSLHATLLVLHEQVRQSRQNKSRSKSTAVARYTALSAYLATIAMYVAVLTSPKDGLALPPAELREHPIMNSLLRSRQLWDYVQDLDNGSEPEADLAEEGQSALKMLAKTSDRSGKLKAQKKQTPALPAETPTHPLASKDGEPMVAANKKAKKAKTATVPENGTKEKKMKRKDKKPKRATLEDLMAEAAPADDRESDFGDEVPLTVEEAAEKARKKKSLRFYTSQIAQKAGKRAAASRQAGGDDDLPYKERIRDRQDRLMREAVQRNQLDASNGEALGDDDDDYDENNLATKMNTDANDYYSTLVGASAQKKADKAARAEAHRQAAAQGAQVYEEETLGKDGKRKITYAIEKNKGLTPKRKKEVRNPRVKKKKKYEEKQKKLASMRPTWKGGEGKGGYKGELTGIKSNLVKSVKL